MNLLITGGTSLIGFKLREYFSKSCNVFATRYESSKAEGCDIFLDVTNKKKVDFLLNHSELIKRYKLDVIIHTAAMTNVDKCETYRDYENNSIVNRPYQENFYATKYLLDAMSMDCKFVFISTNYVFNGNNGPYSEEDIAKDPINYYGESKLAAEKYVLASDKKSLVIRTSFPFVFSKRSCFPKFILDAILQFKKIRVARDMITTPTYIDDICRGIELLLTKDSSGVYHIAGNCNISMLDFARMITKSFGTGGNYIKPSSIDQIFVGAKRPQNSGLKNEKLKELGFKETTLENAVKMFVRDYRKAFK